jgi:AcrR family transcriptional regulator
VGEVRATGSGEKEARRQQILASAGELLNRWSFTDITMDRIADLAGVAKGTLYLYFRTKEALFLARYEDRLRAWYSEVETLATRTRGTVKPAAAAGVIASTLANRPRLIQLHGLLHSSFGLNVSPDVMLDFRRQQRRRISSLAPALAGRIDGLSEEAAIRFLISWAALQPSALQHDFEEPELEIFRIDFEEELAAIITALLQ